MPSVVSDEAVVAESGASNVVKAAEVEIELSEASSQVDAVTGGLAAGSSHRKERHAKKKEAGRKKIFMQSSLYLPSPFTKSRRMFRFGSSELRYSERARKKRPTDVSNTCTRREMCAWLPGLQYSLRVTPKPKYFAKLRTFQAIRALGAFHRVH